MPWRTMDVQQQRVEFVVAAKRGVQPFGTLCQEFEISRPTGYLWLRRYEQHGVAGIAERSRRPLVSPHRTASDLEQRVIEVRQRYPDWGARKLREILAREGIDLARNTIHRILLRHGLVQECDRHRQAPQRFEREQPNQLWQMDWEHNQVRPHEALRMKTPAVKDVLGPTVKHVLGLDTLRAEGAAPNCRRRVRTWGAAVLRPYIFVVTRRWMRQIRLVADAAFHGGVAFAGVDDDFLFFAFLVVDDQRRAVGLD